jgi:hypothetical protein
MPKITNITGQSIQIGTIEKKDKKSKKSVTEAVIIGPGETLKVDKEMAARIRDIPNILIEE